MGNTATEIAAIERYKKADTKGKEMLEEIFSKELFVPKPPANWWEKYKTFEDACKYKKHNPKTILPYTNPKNKRQEYLNAICKLDIIAEAIQGDWIADFGNANQYKYYAYFRWDEGAGFVFVATGYVYVNTRTGIGVRHCFATAAQAEWFGRQFIELNRIALMR